MNVYNLGVQHSRGEMIFLLIVMIYLKKNNICSQGIFKK